MLMVIAARLCLRVLVYVFLCARCMLTVIAARLCMHMLECVFLLVQGAC
jgi:hypothetical protein